MTDFTTLPDLAVRSLGGSEDLLRQAQLTMCFPATLWRRTGSIILCQPIVSYLDELDGPSVPNGTSLSPGLQLVFDRRTLDLSRCFGRYLNRP